MAKGWNSSLCSMRTWTVNSFHRDGNSIPECVLKQFWICLCQSPLYLLLCENQLIPGFQDDIHPFKKIWEKCILFHVWPSNSKIVCGRDFVLLSFLHWQQFLQRICMGLRHPSCHSASPEETAGRTVCHYCLLWNKYFHLVAQWKAETDDLVQV